jgi:hypothetical protein
MVINTGSVAVLSKVLNCEGFCSTSLQTKRFLKYYKTENWDLFLGL